ncbi:Ig-like domain-containing protein [Pseudomonas stutzeri]|nr:Ig-like domain-containing protein [Stutzerimonas stutzeri]
MAPVNDAPVAQNDAVTVSEDVPFSSSISLLANDSDVDGDTLSVVAGNGSYTYTPPADFHGTDTVDYTVTDGSLTDTATLTLTVTPVNDAPLANDDTLTLTVTPVNDAPVAQNDAVTVSEDVPFSSSISLLANDSDVDGDSLSVVDGSYIYTPPADFHGTDTVDYTVTDGSLTDTATLTLTVTPVNDAPVAQNDVSLLASGASFTGVTVRVRVAVSVRLPSVTV